MPPTTDPDPDPDARAAGVLLGLACGDALGRPVVGLSSAAIGREYGRVTEMRAGPDGRPAGATGPATDLTLAVAERLVGGGADPADAGLPSPDAPAALLAGVAPLAVAHRDDPDPDTLARAVTDGAAAAGGDGPAVEACVLYARVLAALLAGADPDAALAAALSLATDRAAPAPLRTALAVADDPDAVSPSTGSVAGAFETVLHLGTIADDAEGAVVAAANRGGDADALAAATGALAGGRFGADALPDRWLEAVDGVDGIRAVAARLSASEPDGG